MCPMRTHFLLFLCVLLWFLLFFLVGYALCHGENINPLILLLYHRGCTSLCILLWRFAIPRREDRREV